MQDWLDSRAKEYETITQLRDADRVPVTRALAIVRDFIAERRLILYGGQAIDFALRLRGSEIYPAHQTPDYDFYSPDSVKDAYDLADRLRAAGLVEAGAIPAIHVQTMRVKTDFVFVADISYAPPSVFSRLPTLTYQGMRVLHPDYQRADMHLAFCFPFNSPPLEDVFHRFGKDLRRLALLEKHFPISDGAALAQPIVGGRAPAAVAALIDPARVAFHGCAGLALLANCYAQLSAAARGLGVADVPAVEVPEIGSVEFKSAGGSKLRVAYVGPVTEPALVIASPWAAAVADEIAADSGAPRPIKRRAYMDSRPPTYIVTTPAASPVHVFSTRHRLLATSTAPTSAGSVRVVSAQYLLLYFLHEAHVAGDGARRDALVRYYRAVWDILAAADAVISAVQDLGVSDGAFARFVECSPFGLTVQTLGDLNLGHAYLARLAKTARMVKAAPAVVSAADMPAETAAPAAYYPDQGKPRPPPFDYAASPVFMRDGDLAE